MGIKNQLMEKHGLTKEEATKLIATYARSHGGEVNLEEIEKDILKISNSIIFSVGKIYRDYDVKHEILECGKDRQRDGLMSLMREGDDEIALQYLSNNYWENVNTWVLTFYDAARHMLRTSITETDEKSISGYRWLVDNLPFKNIYAIANFLNIESEVVELIARYGDEKDFQTYMTDTRYVRDDYDSSTERVERKSCPSALSKKILSKVREELAENGEIKFNRRTMMSGLSAIHRNKDLTDEQKEELQEIYMSKALKGEVDEMLINFLKVRTEIESPYETFKKYLEEVNPKTPWEEKLEMINKSIVPSKTAEIQAAYDSLIEELSKQLESGELTPEQFMKVLNKSRLGGKSMKLKKDEETSKTTLIISIKNPAVRHDRITIQIEADRLQEIVDMVNKGSLSRANAELETISQKGIGELRVHNNYETERRYRYHKEKVLGALSEGEHSPYIIGGETTDYEDLTPLQVKYPYSMITDYIKLDYEETSMIEEQIKTFNRTKVQPKISTHQYIYGKVDGYYKRTVYDFKINGEQYHIKHADWTNGGMYTVIWKGEEEDYPEEGMGLSTSYSEWAHNQCGVDIDIAINLILANPTRFSKIIDEVSRKNDCCGLYPTTHIEKLCKRLMEMEPESELRVKREAEHSKSDEAYINTIVEKATEVQTLKATESKAKGLLAEYEEIDHKNQESLDDDE